MGDSGLSAFVKIILMLPRLLVLGVKKTAAHPGREFKRMLVSFTRLPKFVYLVFRGAFRKFF